MRAVDLFHNTLYNDKLNFRDWTGWLKSNSCCDLFCPVAGRCKSAGGSEESDSDMPLRAPGIPQNFQLCSIMSFGRWKRLCPPHQEGKCGCKEMVYQLKSTVPRSCNRRVCTPTWAADCVYVCVFVSVVYRFPCICGNGVGMRGRQYEDGH